MRKRNTRARIKLTEKEKEDLRRKAQEAGTDMSKYVRGKVLNARLRPVPQLDWYGYARQFKASGQKLNDVIGRAYAQDYLDVPQMRSVMAELFALKNKLENELKNEIKRIEEENSNEDEQG